MATYKQWKHEQTPQADYNPEEHLNASNSPSEATWAATQEAASRADNPSDFINILFNLVKATTPSSNPSSTGASQSAYAKVTDTTELPAEVQSDSAMEDRLPPAPLHSTLNDTDTPIILSQWNPDTLSFTTSVFSLNDSENDHIATMEKQEILHSQSTSNKEPTLCNISLFTNAQNNDQINLADDKGTYAQISKNDIDDITVDNSIITVSCHNGSYHTFDHYAPNKAQKLQQEILRILKLQ